MTRQRLIELMTQLDQLLTDKDAGVCRHPATLKQLEDHFDNYYWGAEYYLSDGGY